MKPDKLTDTEYICIFPCSCITDKDYLDFSPSSSQNRPEICGLMVKSYTSGKAGGLKFTPSKGG